ncbi:MAG: hypothetical protein VX642_05320 [Bdellovibrionota bacterium]|nr:hypothetical protein [Bdellovibrionota bacterium]
MIRIFVLISLFCILTVDDGLAREGLPKKLRLKSMLAETVPFGKELKFNWVVFLPSGLKLNLKASNSLSFFEKQDGRWIKLEALKIGELVGLPGMNLKIDETISLSSSDSEIALDASIFHCSFDGKSACYIDEFQKTFSRDSRKSDNFSVNFYPTKN